MRKVININIPEPCHENWQKMTPKEQGRHCQVCSKTVLDFTKFTDEEIVKAYLNNTALCGRFISTQLNKDLVLARKSRNSYLSYVASALLSLMTSLSFQKMTAQEQPRTEQSTLISNLQVKGKVAVSILKTKHIKGTVLGTQGLPLPGVNVIIKGTANEVQTDFDGNFEITAKVGQTLIFSYVGMKTLEQAVTKHFHRDNKFIMQEDYGILGEVVVGGIIAVEDVSNTYQPSQEELKAKNKEQKRVKNYFKFYKRKAKEKRAHRKSQKALKKTH